MSTSKKSRLDKFKDAARQLETDDDEERFNEHLKKPAGEPMTKFIDPLEAPKTGERVVFFFPDANGTEEMISAVFRDGAWVTTDNSELDVSTATSATLVGPDP